MTAPDWEALASQHSYIVGADECGWGSWAGPLVVCAVGVPSNWSKPTKLNDSKKLRKAMHEELYYLLKDTVTFALEVAQPEEIDLYGPSSALKRCFRSAIHQVREKHPDSLIILDGEVKLSELEHLNFPKADGIVPAVMAASVIGKYLHDQEMNKLALQYPGYNLAGNSGYGTEGHRSAIAKLGICPAHRKSYVPTEKKQRTAEEMALNPDEGMSFDGDP